MLITRPRWPGLAMVTSASWWAAMNAVGTRRSQPVAKVPTGRWEYQVSKKKLAEVLWPTLAEKSEVAMAERDADTPPIVTVVRDAFRVAQHWRYKMFVLGGY